MPGRFILMASAAALLAGCGDRVACDYKGYIIIPEDSTMADDLRWREENRDLMNRRMAVAEGADGQAPFIDKEGLKKAASCP